MANEAESRQAHLLTRLLKRIGQGDDPALLRAQAHRLLPRVGPDDIATAEQKLIDGGYSVQLVQLLSATFMLMAISQEHGGNPKTWLPANHPLQMVMVEHDVFRCLLADLNDVVGAIGRAFRLTDASSEFRKLAHIAEHMNGVKKHIDREDDVIFPYLKNQGGISLCRALEGDHIRIRTEIDSLIGLVVLFNEVNLEQFKAGLRTTVRCLRMTMQEHLSQEDEILFPVALGVIGEAEFWKRIKAVCDELGYCGLHM